MEAEIDDDLAVNRFKRQFYQEPKPIFMSEKEKERIGKLHDEELAKLDDNVQRYEVWKEKKRKRNEWNKVHIRYHKVGRDAASVVVSSHGMMPEQDLVTRGRPRR